uniref:Uncharacterized protein n=1 Tax=Aegilops tauschii subsp. strangulata TaxID=200361 RepID=A0A452XPU7_AEGTS
MSTDPNHYSMFPHSFFDQHVVSFQTTAITSGPGAMLVCLDTSSGINGNLAMLKTTPSMIVSTASPNMILDSSQSLKYGGPMVVEWSYPELQMLNDGLHKSISLSFIF